MSNSFQFGSPDTEPHDLFGYSTFTTGLGAEVPIILDSDTMPVQNKPMTRGTASSAMDQSSNNSLGPSYSTSRKENSLLAHIRPWIAANPPTRRKMLPEIGPGSSHSQQDNSSVAELSRFSIDTVSSARPSISEQPSINSPASPRPPLDHDRVRRRWKVPIPFGSAKRPLPTVSGESSSISSERIDVQPMEEIPLKGLLSPGSKASSKTKTSVHVALSQSSSYALLWSQSMINVWDLGTTPSSQVRAIPTESTCILATVGRRHVAYILGSRGQKLTVRCVVAARC